MSFQDSGSDAEPPAKGQDQDQGQGQDSAETGRPVTPPARETQNDAGVVSPDAITWPAQPADAFATLQERVGHFIIDRKLGYGGQGTVYRAIQLAPIQRVVALKLLNLSVDSTSEAEKLRK